MDQPRAPGDGLQGGETLRVAALSGELDALIARAATLQGELAALRASQAGADDTAVRAPTPGGLEAAPPPPARAAGVNPREGEAALGEDAAPLRDAAVAAGKRPRTSRRGLLKQLGASAAGAAGVAAAAQLARPTPAAAEAYYGTLVSNPNTTYGLFGQPDGLAGSPYQVPAGSFGVMGINSKAAAPATNIPGAGVFGASNGQFGVVGLSNTFVGVYAEGGQHGVQGYSFNGSGVNGFSANNAGVYGNTLSDGPNIVTAGVVGTSASKVGVQGTSTNDTGVYGVAGGLGPSLIAAGVVGTSTSKIGVFGTSSTESGILGISGGAGPGLGPRAGVAGTSTDKFGVFGTSSSNVGVYGLSSTNYGVYGISTSNHGVVGTSSYAGGYGTSGTSPYIGAAGNGNYAGVYGISGASGGIGVLGSAPNGLGFYAASPGAGTGLYAVSIAGFAAQFQGKVLVGGDFTVVGGAKAAAVPHPDGSYRQLYCEESTESWFSDYGRGALVNGRADVRLDRDFAPLVRADDYEVFLTPKGDCKGLYVSSQTPTGFEVRELQGGTSSLAFSYRVVAKRKDIAGPRLERVDLERDPQSGRVHPRGFREPAPLPPAPEPPAPEPPAPPVVPTPTPRPRGSGAPR